MPRLRLALLPFSLALACVAHAGEPTPAGWEFCPVPEALPEFKPGLPTGGDRETAATDISAKDLTFVRDQSTVFSGDVELQRADQWLGTDRLTWWHDEQRFQTEGSVRYQDKGLRLTAERLSGDQRRDRIELQGVQYQIAQQNGNGEAMEAILEGDVGLLTRASFSTCPPSQRQWELVAGEIKVDQANAVAAARNATLRIGRVPVLWLPYARFPTDDRRRSGILMPKLGYNRENGVDFTLPIYLNLAPNYDATLSPRLLGRRGVMLGGEFRYLGEGHRGELDAYWLGNDDRSGRDRHHVDFFHLSRLSGHWDLRTHLRDVSDVDYFQDFGDSSDRTAITLLQSDAGLYGRGHGWQASLRADRWQIASPLLPPGSEPYQRLPRAQIGWEHPLQPWLAAGVEAETVRFRHDSLPGGDRFDLRPYARIDFAGHWWFLSPQLAWRYTGYSLDRRLAAGSDRNPSRSLPIASLDAGLMFERDLRWGGQAVVQTLEPRLFYLRAPYRDQDSLPLFDTQPLSLAWPGLFRDNRFGGADRQGDANQATLALSSRFFGAADGRERLSASLGRIFYFDPPRVRLPGEPADSSEGSAWIGEVNLAIADDWNIGLHQQWEPDRRGSLLTAVRGQWRYRPGGLLNLGYRYRIDQLEQTDLSFVIPINPQWRLVGRWNHSLRDGRSLESLAGFEWNSCCVALRVLARRYIRSADARANLGLYVELELNGVGSFGRDTARLLDNAILGYSR